jgi:uncharacterized membrane protein YfcA
MSLAMGFGSYFAGSTPMGGGTVGFPVLVLLFDQPASLGRDFSLAVQSIGMVSASLYIVAGRQQVAWRMLGASLIGGAISTVLCLLLVAPHVPGSAIELLFASLWAGFGALMLWKLQPIAATAGIRPLSRRGDLLAGLAVGLVGGLLVAVTGVGIDMLIFVALTVLARASPQISIPTSVLLMASMSVVGVATKTATGTWDPAVWGPWLAAAPVVALGAPLGAFIVALLDRRITLVVVSLLCVGQYLWTLVAKDVGGWPLAASLVGIALFVGVAHLVYERLARVRLGEA